MARDTRGSESSEGVTRERHPESQGAARVLLRVHAVLGGSLDHGAQIVDVGTLDGVRARRQDEAAALTLNVANRLSTDR